MDEMRGRFSKRMLWLAVAPVILLGGVIQSGAQCAYCRSEFRKYFDGLGAAGAAANPVERVLFSLLLANTEQPHHL